MSNILDWIKEHVRPYIKYHGEDGEKIDLQNDSPEEIIDKIEEKIEVGIQLEFKF